ncbi:MAG: type I-F CRISPR-associated protein Csy2 [Spirochaetia bacterium]
MKKILLVPHISINNANALSSPVTIGFPAITAWLGLTHALQRYLVQDYPMLEFKAVGIVSHSMDLHVYKGKRDRFYSIIGKANSMKKAKKKSWPELQKPSFIEEPTCSLRVSLVIEYEGVRQTEVQDLKQRIHALVIGKLRAAGGDILTSKFPLDFKIDTKTDLNILIQELMPGYVIIERRDLMLQAMSEGQDSIDALLDYLKVYHICENVDFGNYEWKSKRKTPGWIVPIATGFQGLSELGYAENQRDPGTLHRFAESVITLGEFIMPYRLESIDEMLWHYSYNAEDNLYLCEQKINKGE